LLAKYKKDSDYSITPFPGKIKIKLGISKFLPGGEAEGLKWVAV
jgi:hypothetical protein